MTKEKNKDCLGNRMKRYEEQTTGINLIPNLPVYARIDGRAFHTFCLGLEKPFDYALVRVMQNTTKKLVENTNAALGYVQSDEISLGWEDYSKAPFDGRLFKLQSILASMATAFFIHSVNKISLVSRREILIDKCLKYGPTFDCRVFQLPSMEELANVFVWRENDAFKNSVSMVAQAHFSHKSLQGKNSSEMQEMYFQKTGNNFNDLADELKRGSYFKRVLVTKTLDEEILKKIPENKRPVNNEVIRSEIQQLKLPIMKKVVNKVGVYFKNEEPLMKED